MPIEESRQRILGAIALGPELTVPLEPLLCDRLNPMLGQIAAPGDDRSPDMLPDRGARLLSRRLQPLKLSSISVHAGRATP